MTQGVKVTNHFGLLLRRDALESAGVSIKNVLDEIGFDSLLDKDANILSIGPCFGEEGADYCMQQLRSGLGLDRFSAFVFRLDAPDWCGFRAELRTEAVPGANGAFKGAYVDSPHSVVIRREPMAKADVLVKDVTEALNVPGPCGINDDLVSFGPLQSDEAADQAYQVIENLGLTHVDE